MTRMTSARLAGVTYLLYIAVDAPALALFSRATDAQGIAAKLTRMAEHSADVRIAAVLMLLTSIVALALAVGLYGTTRDEDHELATLALVCRVGEGALNAIAPIAMVGLLWLATTTGPNAPDAAATQTLGAFLLQARNWIWTSCAMLFAVGSTVFCWLLLRGRMIPVPFARLGVIGSALLVVGLPLELGGVIHAPVTQFLWLPIAAFEIPMGFWLAIKGVRPAGAIA
jgi:uncharacterized protein DUF4386